MTAQPFEKSEPFAVVDPDVPDDIARLILTVPAELLPDPLAMDLPERAAWAGKPPRRRKDGDSWRWLQYRDGWTAARLHRGGYVVLPPSAALDGAEELAARIRQASDMLLGSHEALAQAMLDEARIRAAVPREVFDIGTVMQEAHQDDWPALKTKLTGRVEQLETLAHQVLQAQRLALAEPEPSREELYRTVPNIELVARAELGPSTAEIAALTTRTHDVVAVLSAGGGGGGPAQDASAGAETLPGLGRDVSRLADRLAISGVCPDAEQLLRQAAELLGRQDPSCRVPDAATSSTVALGAR